MKLFNQTKYKHFRRGLRNNLTIGEKLLWIELKGSKLLGLKFRRQYSVNKYVMDFFCTELKLGIEIDGISHNQIDSQEKDNERTKYLNSEGIRIIRFKDSEVIENIEKVLQEIKNFIFNIKL